MVQNKALIFVDYPTGWPEDGKHLKIEDRGFDIEQQPPKGGVTVKVHYVSFDPSQRGRMRRPEIKSYATSYEPGKPVITPAAVVTVIKSDHERFKPGEVLYAPRVWTEEYSVYEKDWADTFSPIPLGNPYNLDLKYFVGALGMAGLTAYGSFYEIGQPKKGETIFISAASGAVGQIVGQLAKHNGLTVIGSVGNDKKLDFIRELGFDDGFNYKTETPIDALRRLAPQGIDIYYENVGGEQLEAAITHLKEFGRIIACGMISQYNVKPEDAYPIRNLLQVVPKRLTIRGFIVLDKNIGPKYFEEHQEKMQKWISEGTFKVLMDETHGMDNAAQGFIGMLSGSNFGKAVLVVNPM